MLRIKRKNNKLLAKFLKESWGSDETSAERLADVDKSDTVNKINKIFNDNEDLISLGAGNGKEADIIVLDNSQVGDKFKSFKIDLGLIRMIHKEVMQNIIGLDPELKVLKKYGFFPDSVKVEFSGVDTAATDQYGNFFVNPIFMYQLLDFSSQWNNSLTDAVSSGDEDAIKTQKSLKIIGENVFSQMPGLKSYVWGYAFVLIHEAYHRVYNHFERTVLKKPPINTSDEEEMLYVNLVQDMEINRDIELIYPYLKNVVKACHGFKDKASSNKTWEMLYNEGVGRDVMEKMKKQGKGPKVPPVAPPRPGKPGKEGKNPPGPKQDLMPLNDAAQKGFEDGWNRCIDDCLKVLGSFRTNITNEEWEKVLKVIGIEMSNISRSLIPFPDLNVDEILVEQKTFRQRFNSILKNVKLNETSPGSVQKENIPSTYSEGYIVGFNECWGRIKDEWNPSASILSGDKSIYLGDKK